MVPPGRVAPVPRRIRGELAGRMVVDTDAAVYAWEWDPYPVFYLPLSDVAPGLLASEGQRRPGPFGEVEIHSVGGRAGAAAVVTATDHPELRDTVRVDWAALDAWYEEDEQVFVHPRNPYARVDAIRSSRPVRIGRDGVVLAETSSPVLVFETGLPTRYYINRTEVDFAHLVPSPTVTACPYKGTTGAYWSVRTGETVYPDLAWSYDFPTRQLLPIAGLVAFYNEKVDIHVAGRLLARPHTHFG
jgi:uncharacterized protein (DUF427 family)